MSFETWLKQFNIDLKTKSTLELILAIIRSWFFLEDLEPRVFLLYSRYELFQREWFQIVSYSKQVKLCQKYYV